MSNELVVKKFEGVEVFFMESGWFNATEVAKQYKEKPDNWLVLERTKNLMVAISRKLDIQQNQLVIVKRGSPENGGGTWMHPKLAVHFAYWLDIDFGIWVGEEIEEIIKRMNFHGRKPQFQVNLHPILHFPVVGHREDALMKQTRNTYTAVLDSLGFAAAIYKRVLTNNVSRILIGMPIKPFRRLHGIPAGSRRRTRLYYDYNLRRAMDEIEDIACVDILCERPQSFEEIEKIVYQVARTIHQYTSVCKVNLLEHIPQQEIDFLLEDAV
jgi:hypothetical protein